MTPSTRASAGWAVATAVAFAVAFALAAGLAGCREAPTAPPVPVADGSVEASASTGSQPATEPGPPPATEPTAAPEPVTPPAPGGPPTLDVDAVLAHSKAIEDFGVRPLGSAAEKAAADYVASELAALGYEVDVETFKVPGGTSRNVIARAAGSDKRVIVLGGHLDSKKSTPGANDDAAGCGILLDIARVVANRRPTASVEFVFFGSEEYNDGAPKDHHRGSRYRVSRMTKAQRANTAGMISVDVVGYGPRLHVRTMQKGNKLMSDLLLARAHTLKVPLTYLKDPGPTGWSDHEPYEKAWIPSAWLERLQDPQYHKMGDTTAHLQREPLRQSGQFVLDVVYGLDKPTLDRLCSKLRYVPVVVPKPPAPKVAPTPSTPASTPVSQPASASP
jgi:hypothetical protein